MDTLAEKKAQQGVLDFKLLLSRMERDILKGENEAGWRKVLAREDVWKRADVDRQLQWARVAQTAGDVETALEVLAHVNQIRPDLEEAWTDRLELLLVLDRREALARVVGAAKNHVGEQAYAAWLKLCKGSEGRDVADTLAAPVSAPFEAMHKRQTAIENYLNLFAGREDCFARQWVDKQEGKQGYVPVHRPMEPGDVEEHLRGRKTYGIYLMRSDATVRAAVIDIDMAKAYRGGKLNAEDRAIVKRETSYLLSRITELSQEMGVKPLMEFSGGKGFHFWYLFAEPVDAGDAKRYLSRIVTLVNRDVSAFNLEVFPKQDHLTGKGLGNLVKLPLGIHRLSGKRSFFYDCHDRSTEAQLDYLMGVKPIPLSEMRQVAQEDRDRKIMVHPRWRKWADDFPELFKLESLCIPLAQIMAACRQGKDLSLREEKALFQTIGFLPRAKMLLHHLLAFSSDYNPHLVDFKISRLRGTPLGCKRVHSLLNFEGDLCPFEGAPAYPHPLLHIEGWDQGGSRKSEKVESLSAAMDNLKLAIAQVQRFMT